MPTVEWRNCRIKGTFYGEATTKYVRLFASGTKLIDYLRRYLHESKCSKRNTDCQVLLHTNTMFQLSFFSEASGICTFYTLQVAISASLQNMWNTCTAWCSGSSWRSAGGDRGLWLWIYSVIKQNAKFPHIIHNNREAEQEEKKVLENKRFNRCGLARYNLKHRRKLNKMNTLYSCPETKL